MLIGAREAMFGNRKGGIIPSGCIRVQYLQSTGNQVIKTGFLPNNEAGIFGHITAIPEGGTTGSMFIGVRDSDESQAGFGYVTNANGKAAYRWGVAQGASSRVSDNEGNLSEFSMNFLNSRKATYNDAAFTTNFDTITLAQFSYEAYLFGHNLHGLTYRSKIRIHDVKFSIGSKVVLDFVPVRRVEDGVSVGYMCDLLTGTLYGATGTESFIIGDDLVLG